MKKNILFVCHNAQFNGAEYSLYRLLCELKDEYQISILAPDHGPFAKKVKKLGFQFYAFSPKFPFRWKHEKRGALAAFLVQWKKNIESLSHSLPKPDLIHSNTFFVWEGAALAQHFKCPHVWNLREIVTSSPTWSPALGKEFQLQCMDILTDKFICVSEALKNQLPDSLKQKSLAVHNGLDNRDILPRGSAREWMEQRFNFDTQSKILLTVGNFIPEKGHRYLLPIAKKLTQKYQKVKFLWIGRHDFSYRSIQNEIADMGLQTTFICPGQVDQIGKYMAGADLYLLPSETEAFPTVLLEARLAHLPFIARDCGGAREIAERGGGICTPLNDATAFEQEIIKTLENPSRFSEDLPESFTMKQMREGYQSTYDELIKQGVSPKLLQQRELCLNQLLGMEEDLRMSFENEEKLNRLFRIKGLHRLIKWWAK